MFIIFKQEKVKLLEILFTNYVLFAKFNKTWAQFNHNNITV